MAIAFVSSVSAAVGATGGTTGSFDSTGANLIVVSLAYFTVGNVPTITDSKGNTYTHLTTRTGGNGRQRLSYVMNPTVGTGHTITVGTSGSSVQPAVIAYAFSGVTGYTGLENGGSGGGTSLSAGNVIPTINGSLIFTGLFSDSVNADTVPTGFTGGITVSFNSGTNYQNSAAYLIQTTAASITPTWTYPGGHALTVAADAVFASATEARVSQLPVEAAILSNAPIQARLSQMAIEVAINTSVIPPVSSEFVQFLVVMP